MMLNICLLPVALLGYGQTIQTEWHSSSNLSGPYTEIQSCKEGLGGRLAFSNEWVQVGPQYGYSWPIGQNWRITGQVHGGLGYSNTFHPETQVRQVTKWDGGVSILIHYKYFIGKVGYDHMSNGRGIDPTNHGQEMVSIGIGYEFK